MKLEEGKTYKRDALSLEQWRGIVGSLRPTDLVEYWYIAAGARFQGERAQVCEAQRNLQYTFEITVLKLAPRKPEWDGALIVIDHAGDYWVRKNADVYYFALDDLPMQSTELERLHGPCEVLVNDDRTINVDVARKINEGMEKA